MSAPGNVLFIRGSHDEKFAENIDIMESVCSK